MIHQLDVVIAGFARTPFTFTRKGALWLVSEDLQEGRLVRIELEGPSAGMIPFQAVYPADRLPGPAGTWLLERFRMTSSLCRLMARRSCRCWLGQCPGARSTHLERRGSLCVEYRNPCCDEASNRSCNTRCFLHAALEKCCCSFFRPAGYPPPDPCLPERGRTHRAVDNPALRVLCIPD